MNNNEINTNQNQSSNNMQTQSNINNDINQLSQQTINNNQVQQENIVNNQQPKKKNNIVMIVAIAVIAIIALVLIVKLTGGKSSNLEIDENGAFKSNESNIQTSKAGETATVTNDDDKFTIKVLSSPEKTETESGDQYIELKVLVENLTNNELSTTLYFFNLTDANKNKIYSTSSIKMSAHSSDMEQLETEYLKAKSTEEGYIRFYDEFDSDYKRKTDFSKMKDIKYLEISTFYGVTNYIEIK